jgi:hypothetical protein
VSNNRGDTAGGQRRVSRDGLPGAGSTVAPDELGVLLAAHCRQATTELPPGKPGVRWAADFLAALPAACCRRLPDVVTTGPKVFEFLVGQGFFAAMPSPRLVPLVLGLVAGVSPLLHARSSRQWALWLARVWDLRIAGPGGAPETDARVPDRDPDAGALGAAAARDTDPGRARPPRRGPGERRGRERPSYGRR